jgi:hypothetical protein
VDALLQETHGEGQAIVKVHSHPMDYRRFSSTDDHSDQSLFASVTSLLEDGLRHASAIMLPEGDMIGRVLGEEGKKLPCRYDGVSRDETQSASCHTARRRARARAGRHRVAHWHRRLE